MNIDFIIGFVLGILLSVFIASIVIPEVAIGHKSKAIEAGVARYVVIDNRGNTEFQWITNKIEQAP